VLSETLRLSVEACWSEKYGAALKSKTIDITFRDKNCINCGCGGGRLESKHELNFMSMKSCNKNHATRHLVP
jgi:hypothetical protein